MTDRRAELDAIRKFIDQQGVTRCGSVYTVPTSTAFTSDEEQSRLRRLELRPRLRGREAVRSGIAALWGQKVRCGASAPGEVGTPRRRGTDVQNSLAAVRFGVVE